MTKGGLRCQTGAEDKSPALAGYFECPQVGA